MLRRSQTDKSLSLSPPLSASANAVPLPAHRSKRGKGVPEPQPLPQTFDGAKLKNEEPDPQTMHASLAGFSDGIHGDQSGISVPRWGGR